MTSRSTISNHGPATGGSADGIDIQTRTTLDYTFTNRQRAMTSQTSNSPRFIHSMSTRQSSIRSNGALSLSGDHRFLKRATCLLKSVSGVASKTVDVLFSKTESKASRVRAVSPVLQNLLVKPGDYKPILI